MGKCSKMFYEGYKLATFLGDNVGVLFFPGVQSNYCTMLISGSFFTQIYISMGAASQYITIQIERNGYTLKNSYLISSQFRESCKVAPLLTQKRLNGSNSKYFDLGLFPLHNTRTTIIEADFLNERFTFCNFLNVYFLFTALKCVLQIVRFHGSKPLVLGLRCWQLLTAWSQCLDGFKPLTKQTICPG